MVLTRSRVDELVKDDRVRVSIYIDPEIFEEELKRIFYTTWIYLGHKTEVPTPGDFKTTYIGLAPVVLSRDAGGRLHVFLNQSAATEGAVLLAWERGNEAFLKDMDQAAKNYGLSRIARVDDYRGFVFASMAEKGPSLADHLGLAKDYLDEICDKSPTGEVEVTGGVWKHTYIGNWKLQVEGGNDGYHPDFLHRVAGLAFRRQSADVAVGGRRGAGLGFISSDKGRGLDLGNGHSVMDSPGRSAGSWEELEQRYPKEYLDALVARQGKERTVQVLSRGWRMLIFPYTAFASDTNIRIIRPLTVGTSEIRQYHIHLPGVPDQVNLMRVRAHEGFYGPAGMGSPDDIEMFARMHQGYQAGAVHPNTQWAMLNRGINVETTGPKGERVAHVSSEVQTRAIYYAWRALMKGEDHVTVPNRR